MRGEHSVRGERGLTACLLWEDEGVRKLGFGVANEGCVSRELCQLIVDLSPESWGYDHVLIVRLVVDHFWSF